MGYGWSLLVLVVVAASIPLALQAFKRLQQGGAGGGARLLQVVAQLPLGPRERVVLVRVHDRALVLGVTAQQVTLLSEADAASLPGGAVPPDFGGILRAIGAKASR